MEAVLRFLPRTTVVFMGTAGVHAADTVTGGGREGPRQQGLLGIYLKEDGSVCVCKRKRRGEWGMEDGMGYAGWCGWG